MERFARLCLDHDRVTLFIVFAMSAAAISGLPRLTTEVSYRAYLGDDHPSIVELDDLISTFGGGLPVLAVWSCKQSAACESVFDDDSLSMASEVESELLSLPIVESVSSVASAPIMTLENDALTVRRFVEGQSPIPQRETLVPLALRDPFWIGNLVSSDGLVGAIVVQLASSDQHIAAAIVPQLQAILEPHERAGFEFHLVGDPVDFVVSGGQMQAETPRMIPVMVVLVGAVILLLLRSIVAAALALSVAGLSIAWTLGLMGWLGWPQTELSQPLPAIVFVVGVCSALHLLARYAAKAADAKDDGGRRRRSTVLLVAREIGPACMVASLTTAMGFLSFATSGLESFLQLGCVAAWGTLSALALTFSLIPVLLVRLPSAWLYRERTHRAWESGIRNLSGISRRKAPAVIASTAVAFVVSAIGVAQIRVDVDEQEMLGDGSLVVRWARFVEDNLRKADTLEISLEAPAGERIPSEAGMDALSDLAAYLPTIDGLGRSLSLLEMVDLLDSLISGGDSNDQAAEARGGRGSQLVAALRMSPESRLEHWLDFEERRARISVEADPVSVERREQILASVSRHLEDALPPGWDYRLSGPLAVFTDFVHEIQLTQVRSFSTAAVAIGATIFVFLWMGGSRLVAAGRWALVAVISSAFPIAIVLGTMGWLGIPIDVATAMVAAIILGIAVDDSVHLIVAYRDERNRGRPSDQAISEAVGRVGRAIVTTSLALSVGFFSLMMSSWQSIASFGFLSGIAIIGALLADLVVLPALILGFSKGDPGAPAAEIAREPGGVARSTTSCFVVLSVLLCLALAGSGLEQNAGAPRIGCVIERTGIVSPIASLQPDCALEPFDSIRSIAVGGEKRHPRSDIDLAGIDGAPQVLVEFKRNGRLSSTMLPVVTGSPREAAQRFGAAVLIATLAVALALFLLWNSSARSSVPFAVVCAAIASISIFVLSAPGSGTDASIAMILAGLLPPSIAHLMLTFPHPRPILRRLPALPSVAYGLGLALSSMLVWSYHVHPALWRTAVSLVSVATAACWLGLVASLASTQRQASSALERRRARAALLGSFLVPGIVLVAGLLASVPHHFLAPSVAMSVPMSIGYAIGRHQRHDLRPHVQTISAYLALVAVSAAMLAVGITSLPTDASVSPVSLLFGALLALVGFLVARDVMWEWLKSWLPSTSRRLRALRDESAEVFRSLRTSDECGQRLAELLHEGMRPSGVSVYLRSFSGWRLVGAEGGDPPALPRSTFGFLEAGDRLIDLGVEGGAVSSEAFALREQGIAIVARLTQGAETLGAALIKAPMDSFSYTSTELQFTERVAALASDAVHRARLVERLIQSERYATIGHIAAGLMHDIGKPVTIIRQDARCAARDEGLPVEHREALGRVEDLAEDALRIIDQLLDHARGGLAGHHEAAPVREIVDRAVDAIELRHGRERVLVRLESGLPAIGMPESLRLALTNLLDNALLASAEAPVEIMARRLGSLVEINVVDRGAGMSDEVAARAFEPFFTTRSSGGGRGIGLAVARTLIEGLGGRVDLDSALEKGTKVTVSIPVE